MKHHIEQLIAQNQLEQAIAQLFDLYALCKKLLPEVDLSEQYNQLILLSAKLQSALKDQASGLIRPDDANLYKAQIINSLLSQLNSIPEAVFEAAKPPKKAAVKTPERNQPENMPTAPRAKKTEQKKETNETSGKPSTTIPHSSMSWATGLGILLLVSYFAVKYIGFGSGEKEEKQGVRLIPASSLKGIAVGTSKYHYETVLVEGGSFQMGSSVGHEDEKPVHSVSVSTFRIGKYEVTQSLWFLVMGSKPSSNKPCDLCPVEKVSWDEVQQFIQKLNQLTGRRYRLPTEAEWEFAARGGNKSKGYLYAGSNRIDEVAWTRSNGANKSQTVGGKQPNELGIYDMTGNVWEWCSDFYSKNFYYFTSPKDPKGPLVGTQRVNRGGCWGAVPDYNRLTVRHSNLPAYSDFSIGFRLVLDVQ